jgi:hypothetical protein
MMPKISHSEPQLMIDIDFESNQQQASGQLTRQVMIQRQKIFRDAIIGITKEAHDKFLDQLAKT